MGRKTLASLVLIVAVLALNFGAQAGAAKQTQAEITCASPGTTTIDWLPGQTTFTINFYFNRTDGLYLRIDGIMKGGGKYTMTTPQGAVNWTANVSGESLAGYC